MKNLIPKDCLCIKKSNSLTDEQSEKAIEEPAKKIQYNICT